MTGFRVDANETIATGHLVRCMSLAAEWRRQGEDCVFFLAEDKETDRLRNKDIPYHILHTNWNDLDAELPVFLPLLDKMPLDRLIVDSYQATAHYLSVLEQHVPVCYIDDLLADTYSVSAILHYGQFPGENLCEKLYKNTGTKVLAGMAYTPLREEFFPPDTLPKREKSILITTGGTDPFHVTKNLLRMCLDQFAHPETAELLKDYRFDVIVGSMNQDEPKLRALSETFPQIRLHKNVSRMSSFMYTCEMAVSAGGTTLFELCACKTPTICFSFADNQTEFTRQMGQRGYMLYTGDARCQDVVKEIAEKLLTLAGDAELRKQYSEYAGQLVDGLGVKRIVEKL